LGLFGVAAEDDAAFDEISAQRSELVFDLDTYKLFIKGLNKPKVNKVEFN